MENEWKSIEPGIWKPENKGDSIEGVLLAKKTEVGTNNSNAYVIETKNNEQLMVWGSTVLDDKMIIVKVGDMVKIEFNGKQPNKKGQPTKLFKVYTK